MPSMETMMPPFFFTCASHCWSSLTSTRGSHERTVCLEQVQDFAPRDRHSQGSQPILYLLVHLIDGLVLPQVQTPHQQHDVHTKGETGQGQRIGGCTAGLDSDNPHDLA